MNAAVAADAVTGHWDGSRLHAVDAVAALLGLQLPPRPKKAQPPRITPPAAEEDVSAETWEPIDWPVHDDYPGEPWIGADDPFTVLEC